MAVPERVLAAVVGVLVLLAVGAGVLAASRDVPQLDPASPEGVTQAFLQAAFDADEEAAAEHLSATSGCDVADVRQAYLPDDVRVVVESTEVDGDRAVVTLVVTDVYGEGLFGSSEYEHTERARLAREDGAWRLTALPWLLPSCDDDLVEVGP